MKPHDLICEIQGLPFIHPTFHPEKLMTFVATTRRNIENRGAPLSTYIHPDYATNLYSRNVEGAPTMPAHQPLSNAENFMLSAAMNNVKELVPEWTTLVEVPLRVHKINDSRVSLTNPLIPQQIFLGESAFSNITELEELIVHELSHIWCSLICEIYDFQIKSSKNDYVLPSGTGGKNPRGVLLAALFAISAANYHRRLLASGSSRARASRVNYLQSYFHGSVSILQRSAELSVMGNLILTQLETASKMLQPIAEK